MPFLTQLKGENDHKKYFTIKLNKRMVPDHSIKTCGPPDYQSDMHQTELPALALLFCFTWQSTDKTKPACLKTGNNSNTKVQNLPDKLVHTNSHLCRPWRSSLSVFLLCSWSKCCQWGLRIEVLVRGASRLYLWSVEQWKFNPTALRMAKTQWSFGHSKCNRVNQQNYNIK